MASAAAAAAQQRRFNELRSQAENILQYQPSKGTVVTQLGIAVCLGVFFALWAALAPGQAAAWRITSGVLACGVPLAAVAFFLLDAYQRRRLRGILRAMQFALDLDISGELR